MVRKNRDKEKGKIEEEKTKLAKETACLIASKKQTNKQTKTVKNHEQLMNERRNLWSRQLINQSVSRSYAKHFFHVVFFDERFDK